MPRVIRRVAPLAAAGLVLVLALPLASASRTFPVSPPTPSPASPPAPATIPLSSTAADCPVTPWSDEARDWSFSATWYGGDGLWAGLHGAFRGQWFVGGVKVLWYRPTGAPLAIEGRRLDAPAPPLKAPIDPEEYQYRGFQPSVLGFPTEGCWEVVGRVGEKELRFVVYVHPAVDDPTHLTRRPTPGSEVWAALRRPLMPPTPGEAATCPRSVGQRIGRIEGVVLGPGPVYVQAPGPDDDEVFRLGGVPRVGGGFGVPVRWIAGPTYLGPLLLRGRQVDGPNELHFGVSEPGPEAQVWGAEHLETPDWRVWGSEVRVAAPGCYAIQIDGADFSEVIVFEAVSAATPSGGAPPTY